MEPLISVIIPIYNMEAYLSRCLDSVLNNTYRNLEIICVDDGSRDGSAEILRAYAEKNSRVVPIFKENGGVSSARNAGLDRMTGEYLSFIDPDDFVHPQYFELLYRALQESGEEIAMCDFTPVEMKDDIHFAPISFNPAELKVLPVSTMFLDHISRSFCWVKLFRADLARDLRFHEDIRYAEDGVFLAELYERKKTEKTAQLPYHLYYYLQREDSLTKTVGVPQKLQAARVFSQKLFSPESRDDIYLDHVLKRGLDTRYLASYILPDREAAKECGAILKKCRKKVRRAEWYGTGKKTAYLLMICFPRLYWLYRIVKDPSMWKWEKVERKKRRAVKKKSQTGRV